MSDLVDFLLARIFDAKRDAERVLATGTDRYVVCYQPGRDDLPSFVAAGAGVEYDPARVLAEVEAKRLIVEIHEMTTIRPAHVEGYWWDAYCRNCTMDGEYADITQKPREDPCPTLRALALAYADHPDHREGWRL